MKMHFFKANVVVYHLQKFPLNRLENKWNTISRVV